MPVAPPKFQAASRQDVTLLALFCDRPACLALGLFTAFALYNLGVPSLWMDEILVPMTAAHSMEFIVNQSTYIEIHPPVYYAIVKFLELWSKDDFFLRLFSVVCGLFTCGAGYGAARVVLPLPQARAALVLLMANTQFFFLIRNVRPYAAMLALFALILFLYLRLCNEDRPRLGLAVLLGLLLGLAFSLVYTSLFILVAVVGSLALAGLLAGRPGLVGRAGLAGLVAGLFVAGFYVLFIAKSSLTQTHLGGGMDLASVSAIYANALLDNVFYFNNMPARLALAALALHGLWLLRGNRPFTLLTLALMAVPYLQLVASHNAFNFWGRHLAFLMLPVAMAQARSASALLSRLGGPAPVLAAAALGLASLAGYHHRFYAVDSYDVEVIGDNYKTIARHLIDTATPGQALNFTGGYLEKCTGWYLDRYASPTARLNAPLADAPVHSVIVGKEYTYAGGSKEGFIERFGPFESEEQFRSVTIFRRSVAKTGPTDLAQTPFTRAFAFDYTRLYAEAAVLADVNLATSARGFSLVPTRPDTPAVSEYTFTNSGGNTHFGVVLDYRSAGWGNVVAVDVRFDDGPFAQVFATGGMDPRRQAIVHFEHAAPFTTMTIRLRLVCHDSMPSTTGTGLGTVGLEGFTVIAAKDAATVTNILGPAAYNAYLLENHETECFPAASGIEQRLIYDPGVISCVRPGDINDPRAAMCSLAPGVGAGDIDIQYTAPHNDAVFLPRISGEASLLMAQFLNPDGTATGFFTMRGNSNTRWTPVSGQYKLPLPALTGTLRIHLEGKAQLWTVDGQALFRGR